MKGRKGVMRVESLINNDRMKNSEGFTDLLTCDIDKVLKEYFDYKGYPVVAVSKNGNIFTVNITLNAENIRAFSILPQEK